MSRIDRDAIRHLEHLARIDLSADEVAPITEQLNRIVALVERLQTVDVEGVEPTRAMSLDLPRGDGDGSAAGADARQDAVTPGLDRAVVLAQAPDATDEFFRVPRVIARGEES